MHACNVSVCVYTHMCEGQKQPQLSFINDIKK